MDESSFNRSIPDDELLNLAIQNKLRSPGVLEQQVRRMLADERSRALTTNFPDQWLALRNLEKVAPDMLVPGHGAVAELAQRVGSQGVRRVGAADLIAHGASA